MNLSFRHHQLAGDRPPRVDMRHIIQTGIGDRPRQLLHIRHHLGALCRWHSPHFNLQPFVRDRAAFCTRTDGRECRHGVLLLYWILPYVGRAGWTK